MSIFEFSQGEYYVVYFDETNEFISKKHNLVLTNYPVDTDQLNKNTQNTEKTDTADETKYPYNLCGYISYDGTGNASGQFVGNARFVLTAAHCVYDHKTGYEKYILFSQARSPIGALASYKIIAAIIPKKWKDQSDINQIDYTYDFAVLITDREAIGTTSGSYLPYRKTSVSNLQVVAVGYPSVSGTSYRMKSIQGTTSISVQANSKFYQINPKGLGKGASGGAWLTDQYGKWEVASMSNFVKYGSYFGLIFDDKVDELFSMSECVLSNIKNAEMSNAVRFFTLNNNAWVIVAMEILYRKPNSTETLKYKQNINITINKKGVVDLLNIAEIPDGSEVWLKAEVKAGFDNEASERFLYNKFSTRNANYELTGTTIFGNKLTLLSCNEV